MRQVTDYANDTDILFILTLTIQNILSYINLIEDWYSNWRFKINQSKSIHITFILTLTSTQFLYTWQTPKLQVI